MAINLSDISEAVKFYLDHKVVVTVTPPVPAGGAQVNPNENFTFSVKVKNADAANGGATLRNILYRVRINNPAVASIIVPAASLGTARDDNGAVLQPGTLVGFMVFTPGNGLAALRTLAIGDTDTFNLSGKAKAQPPTGGTTTISARICADVDLDELFPKGLCTPVGSSPLVVVG